MTPIKILVVDTSERFANFLADLMAKKYKIALEKYRVAHPDEMKDALSQQKWEAIFADCQIPGFSAIDAWHIFKESGLDIPFIFTSGRMTEEDVKEMLDEGATGFVRKDEVDQLTALIEKYLMNNNLTPEDHDV